MIMTTRMPAVPHASMQAPPRARGVLDADKAHEDHVHSRFMKDVGSNSLCAGWFGPS